MVASAPTLLGSLPIPRTRLIGREAETPAARAFLLEEAVPLLTLTGPGGVGKTRLALTIANDVAAHFTDGVDVGRSGPTDRSGARACRGRHGLQITIAADRSLVETLAATLRSKTLAAAG